MLLQYNYPEMEAANGLLVAASSLQIIFSVVEFTLCYRALKSGKVKSDLYCISYFCCDMSIVFLICLVIFFFSPHQ